MQSVLQTLYNMSVALDVRKEIDAVTCVMLRRFGTQKIKTINLSLIFTAT